MENKKPKALDILRLIVAILILICSVILCISLFLGIYGLFTDNHEDGFSGLIFLFIIPAIIIDIAFVFIGIRWIKKYNKNKNIPLIERKTDVVASIIMIALAIFFLSYISIPLVIYWGLDLIEAIMKNKLLNKSRVNNVPANKEDVLNNIQSSNNSKIEAVGTNSTKDNTKHYCKNCGHEVDYRYARFCEYCGSEIDYNNK